jgi:hypothetical protein
MVRCLKKLPALASSYWPPSHSAASFPHSLRDPSFWISRPYGAMVLWVVRYCLTFLAGAVRDVRRKSGAA